MRRRRRRGVCAFGGFRRGRDGFLGREQKEPDEDHKKAERCRKNEVLVLIVHRLSAICLRKPDAVHQSIATKVKLIQDHDARTSAVLRLQKLGSRWDLGKAHVSAV